MKKLSVLFVITISLCAGVFAQKKPTPKQADPLAATMFFITIEHNGEKTDIKSTQFEGWGGTAFTNDSEHGKMTLYFAAGNEKKDDDRFSFSGSLENDAKGAFQLGNGKGTNFSFITSKFPDIPQFLCLSGAYNITAMPLKGDYVEGTFSANCEADPTGNQLEHYNLSGSFKLLRQ